MQTLPTSGPDTTRPAGRAGAMTALFSGAALMNAAMAVASAIGTIVAGERLGVGWGGVPNTAGIVGTGLGALALTSLMNRRGRRSGLVLGYATAAFGAVIAVLAVTGDDVVALTGGMLLLGLGNAGAQLSRYAAAELYPPERRGFALGTVVWAGAVGAVGGPLLLGAAGGVAGRFGGPAPAGPYVLAALAALVAVAAAAGGAPSGRLRTVTAPAPMRHLLRGPSARSALAVMVTAQVVMVAVMTAVPLDMHMHGEGLGAVGMTVSAHTLGMFALSPLTGRLFDRAGARPVMLAGLGTLLLSTVLAAGVPEGHAVVRAGALFLLGYGWNLCFVGGSGLLARDLPETQRVRAEGTVDAMVWIVAAVASLASTAVLSSGGYAALAVVAGVITLLPAPLALRRT